MAKPSKDKKKSKSNVDQAPKAQPAGTSPTSVKINKEAGVKGALRMAKKKKTPEPKGMDLSMFRTECSEGDREQLVGSAKTQVMGASGHWETELDHKVLMKTLRNWMNSSAEMVKKSRGMGKEDWQKFVEEADWSDITKTPTRYFEFLGRLRFWDRERLAEIADTLADLIDGSDAEEDESIEEETPKVQDQKAVVKTKETTKVKAKAKQKEKAKAERKAKETGKAKVKAKTKKG